MKSLQTKLAIVTYLTCLFHILSSIIVQGVLTLTTTTSFLANDLVLIYKYQAFPVLIFCKRKFLSTI